MGDVAVADGGQGDDAPPERVEGVLDGLVGAVLVDEEPGYVTEDERPRQRRSPLV
jgi:hypothetical protein